MTESEPTIKEMVVLPYVTLINPQLEYYVLAVTAMTFFCLFV